VKLTDRAWRATCNFMGFHVGDASLRVILVHNPSAGSEDHSARDLEEQIVAAGHSLIGSTSSPKKLRERLGGEGSCDLVAVAGGDGTVGKVAGQLAGSGVPMTVIPVGTANNIARALGLNREHRELIGGWAGGEVRAFDAATAAIDRREVRFFEGFGFGIFPRVMLAAESAHSPDEPDARLDRDRILTRETLEAAPLEPYAISIDGVDYTGRYLMMEVMNIAYLGPHLEVAPTASPLDGELDVVLASPEHREAIAVHVDELRAGHGLRSWADLPAVRARRIVVTTTSSPMHRDGDLVDGVRPASVRVEIVVEPRALQVLVPVLR
jgi:diacylglycerol kinase family enzyme